MRITYKSPAVMLCRARKGACSLTISSMPILAWKLVSMEAKMEIEPSAPVPLENIVQYHRPYHRKSRFD